MLLQKKRFREIEALAVSNARSCLQIGKLLECFDAFGNNRHSKCRADGFNGFQNALAARALMNVCYE